MKCYIFVLQVKIAILQYLQGLIGLMDPSDFTNSGGILLNLYNFLINKQILLTGLPHFS